MVSQAHGHVGAAGHAGVHRVLPQGQAKGRVMGIGRQTADNITGIQCTSAPPSGQTFESDPGCGPAKNGRCPPRQILPEVSRSPRCSSRSCPPGQRRSAGTGQLQGRRLPAVLEIAPDFLNRGRINHPGVLGHKPYPFKGGGDATFPQARHGKIKVLHKALALGRLGSETGFSSEEPADIPGVAG